GGEVVEGQDVAQGVGERELVRAGVGDEQVLGEEALDVVGPGGVEVADGGAVGDLVEGAAAVLAEVGQFGDDHAGAEQAGAVVGAVGPAAGDAPGGAVGLRGQVGEGQFDDAVGVADGVAGEGVGQSGDESGGEPGQVAGRPGVAVGADRQRQAVGVS